MTDVFMLQHAHPPRLRWAPALALLGTLGLPTVAHAGFEVTYLFTNSDGQALTNDRLTAFDMSNRVNQASCECGEQLAARIFLNNNDGSGMPVPPTTRVLTYVGTNCDEGQNAFGNFDPCVQLLNLQANEYDDGGITAVFDQVWLSSGVNAVNQDISVASPIDPCSPAKTGAGKIWICLDSNGDSKCLSDEFISPTVLNSTDNGGSGMTPDGMDGGQPTAGDGITYDYLPPQNTLTGFRSSAGDGRVEVTWDRVEVDGISGFRVLCADSSGAPAKSLVSGTPSRQVRRNGTLYYTAGNLCEASAYMPDPNAEPIPEPVPEGTGTGTGGDDGRDTAAPSTSVGFDGGDDQWRDNHVTGTSSTSGDGGSDGPIRGSDSGSGSSGSGDSGETGGPNDTGGDCGADATSPLCDLDWAFVCSDHVPAGTVNADITGLRNGEEYQFLVIAYDSSGNPLIVSPILTNTPVETTDFWEQCEQQGDLCGNGGFCHCRTGVPTGAAWLGMGLFLLGLRRLRSAGR